MRVVKEERRVWCGWVWCSRAAVCVTAAQLFEWVKLDVSNDVEGVLVVVEVVDKRRDAGLGRALSCKSKSVNQSARHGASHHPPEPVISRSSFQAAFSFPPMIDLDAGPLDPPLSSLFPGRFEKWKESRRQKHKLFPQYIIHNPTSTLIIL